MTNPNIPVRRTGSADNERVQLNKALSGIDNTLERSDQWDASFAWGDHRDAGYEVALTETQQFENLGIPTGLALVQLLDTDPAGSDRIAIQASWNRLGDENISYDLEIRKSAVGVTTDPLTNAALYSVPIIANDLSVSSIRYTDFFDPDQRYWFRVRIRRDRLVSPWSDFVNIATTQNLSVPPLPTNVAVTPFLEGIRLSWDYDYVANPFVAFIEVRRGGTLIASVSRPTKIYLDEPLAANTTYSYTLQAVSFAGIVSGLTSPVSGQPEAQKEGTITIRSATAPITRPDGSPLQVGDRWLKSDEGDLPHSWTGTLWLREYTSIDGGNIITGTLDANRIIAGTITTDRMTANTINGDRITANTLNADRITAGTITTDRMTANTINGDRITANTLNADRITAGTITTDRMTANTINGDRITANTLNADRITAGTITTDRMTVNTINADRLTDGTVGSVKFANDIQSDPFTSGSVGWRIRKSQGDAEFNNVIARGTLISGAAGQRRTEITPPPSSGTDFIFWSGDGAKTDANGRSWIKSNGDAKFGGRVNAAQLEGSVLDAVPIDVTGDLVSNFSNVTWVTVANRYVELPETIRRPRRPFVSIVTPIFGPGVVGSGAWARCQIAIQDDNGTYGSFFTIGQEFTIDTTSVGSVAPISIGSQTTGNRGFRVRVQFRPFTNGQEAQTNRFSGLFIALPAGSGFVVRNDTTNGAVTTQTSDPSLLVPPNFGDGWTIPP